MEQIALVLEGGGMRGAFTAGVLDFLLARELYLDRVYGVSAGACQACSYLCRQQGRGLRVWAAYAGDPRFCSLSSLLRTGDLFNADFNYDQIPRRLDPIDNAAYQRSGAQLIAVVTNVRTGQAEYLPVRDMLSDIRLVQASASLPLVSNMVPIGGQKYLDGGIADPIPLRRALADGFSKAVVVLTRAADYQKQPDRAMALLRLKYARYPQLLQAMRARHLQYNQTLALIAAKEAAGRAFVIRPDAPPAVGRVERDPAKLTALHDAGFAAAEKAYARLREFVGA